MFNRGTLIVEIEQRIKTLEELKKIQSTIDAFYEKHHRYSQSLFYFTDEQIKSLFSMVSQDIYDQLKATPKSYHHDHYSINVDDSIFGISNRDINGKIDQYKELVKHLKNNPE